MSRYENTGEQPQTKKKGCTDMKTKTYIIGNATVVVSRPMLNESEQAKREGVILNELQQYGKAMTEKNSSE